MDARRKALLFRANHRGMKETDILLGKFARLHLADMSEADLEAFESLIEEQDIDVLDWVSGKQALPTAFDTPLFQRIRSFKPHLA